MSIALSYNIQGQASELHDLIQGCIRNERGAQEKMYSLFYARMMGVVKRYIDHQEQAEEVLNNGFLRAFQKIEQYTFQGSFEGWLRKIVFHSVSDYVKQNARYNEKVVLAEKDQFVHKDHADNLYYNELLQMVQSLPEATRNVFNMYVMEGFAHKEIGKMLGISEGTSKWHLSEGRRILKDKIEKLNLHLKK
ncbi:MAG: sigma-70 family RNA polymerase sigma factor [Bacteroidetes bacterium]|nr:sigma-70 family RNA polymerase sigma factor [Bacteroidota bacterium]MBS1780022.1 sigma-70 family RNA polymerase sigma factor [Bacteroidota bacterium]